MTKKMVALCIALLMFVSFCFAVDPVEGFWISYDDKTGNATAGWKICQKDGKLFGTILSLAGYPQDIKATGAKGRGPYDDFPVPGDMSEMLMVGTPWIFNLTKVKDGKWIKGFIVDPNDGKKYKCKITFHKANGDDYTKDTLEVRGEIGAGIGRSQYWQSVTKEEACGLK